MKESDGESQRIAELEEAGRKLTNEYEESLSKSARARFEAVIEWLLARSIGVSERCLMELATSYPSGLTPLEMSKQSNLQAPAIGGRSLRVKTISTTLNRLEAKRFARRVREGRPFRYFLTPNGVDDLAYHFEERKKMKQRKYVDWGLSLQHLQDRRKVIETETLMLQYQRGARRKVRGFDMSAVDVMKWCLDLAKTVLVLKHALINAGDQKLRSEAIAQGEQCLAQLAGRQRAELYIALLERFSG